MVNKANPFNVRVAIQTGVDDNGDPVIVLDKSERYKVVPNNEPNHGADIYADNANAKTKKRFVNVYAGEGGFSDIGYASLWRLTVLSTYLNYTGNADEDGVLMIGNTKAMRPMKKHDIKKCLNLTPREFDRFLEDVCQTDENGALRDDWDGKQNYLYPCDGVWKISRSFFVHGVLARGRSTPVVRGFTEQIRRIHSVAKHSQHRQLGMAVRMLPYLNRQYNVVCVNPDEKDPQSIIPMTVNEVAVAIGLDEHNSERTFRKFCKEMLDIELEIDGIPQLFCVIVTSKYGSQFVVNPSFFYNGCNEVEAKRFAYGFLPQKSPRRKR